MKRVIALVLIFVMCLSLCACGGSSEKNFLTSHDWKDVGHDKTDIYTFKKDGTGTAFGINSTWIMANNKLTISYPAQNGTMNLEFSILENDGSKMLIECPNKIIGARILVNADDYENEKQKVREYMLKNAEVLNQDAVYDEIHDNVQRAAVNHSGKIVKWTGKVYSVRRNSCEMSNEQSGSMLVNPIDVDMSEEELIKFDTFDTITVIGILEVGQSGTRITGAFVTDVAEN